MSVYRSTFSIDTKGNCDIIDITPQIKKAVFECKIKEGLVNVFVIGSTASITTIEYESGLIKDIKNILDKLIPANKDYEHHKRWHDDNGHSHIRASIIGPDVTIPISNSNLLLGTWQQIVLIDFDTRARTREIVITCIGN
ncbi:MAG: secondary thiamine-phosphate synthase enzyme YjbQ [Planctomycetota bacterium]